MIEPTTPRPKTLTYFPFMAADWLTSPKVRALPPVARSAVIDLLAWSWRHDDCALPNDEAALGAMAGIGADWPKHKAAVLAFFPVVEHSPSFRRSPTLYQRFLDAVEAHGKRVDAANARWKKGAEPPHKVSPPPELPAPGARLAEWAEGHAPARAEILAAIARAMGDEVNAMRRAYAELEARLTGMHGTGYDAQRLEDALIDFLAKHSGTRAGFSALKRFLNAGARDEPPAARPTKPSPAMLGQSAGTLAEKYLT